MLLSAGGGFWAGGGPSPHDWPVVRKSTSSLIRSVRKYLPLAVVIGNGFLIVRFPPAAVPRLAGLRSDGMLLKRHQPCKGLSALPWYKLTALRFYCNCNQV
jgi:hypothetical protein